MRLTVYFPEESPTSHEFVGQKLTIGRLVENSVQLDDSSVSSRHAELIEQNGEVVLRDLGSTNGTFLNGAQVTGEQPLKAGDEIFFGGVRSVFMEQAGEGASAARDAARDVASPPAPVDTSGTGIPENFRPLSPLPPAERKRDTLALTAWCCLGLGLAAALYAVLTIATL
jgi:pSer/pThr/pTyr-binding forkhead associated (FHA) protein